MSRSTAAPSSSAARSLTIGVDVGTTSVKALVVDASGEVRGRARVAHPVLAPEPDKLEHDAARAWRRGPRRAVSLAREGLEDPVAGVTVAAMVPSMTAVDARGVPRTPGLLYGDVRGRWADTEEFDASGGSMPDAEGFLSWTARQAPDAMGYWPAQAVATHALSGSGVIDSAVMSCLGRLQVGGKWNEELVSQLGADVAQLPRVEDMCRPAATLTGTDAVVTGGTVDAFCDQIVSGATEVGDVLVLFGATLIVWAVTDTWVEAPGLLTLPHTVADRVMIGGPSNAGALFVDWARQLLRGLAPHHKREPGAAPRRGDPTRVPVWLPYLRGERTPFFDPNLRASLHGIDIAQGPAELERGIYESSGFVIRSIVERAGLSPRRVVATGGGSSVVPWMAAVADATGLPVDSVGVPEGAALGAAYLARVAAGLEEGLEGAQRWARRGPRIEPDAQWAKACDERYRRFAELGPQG
jgi:xylulokinase